MEVGDVPTPMPGRRRAGAGLRRGDEPHRPVAAAGAAGAEGPFPHVAGGDVCGVVSAIGPGVSRCRTWRRAIGSSSTRACRAAAAPPASPGATTSARLEDAGRADPRRAGRVRCRPPANLAPAPRARLPLDDAQLAAIPTVPDRLADAGRPRRDPAGRDGAGDRGGSGVGTAAIQIAKLWGARVIATASTDAKLAAARALGADDAINHATGDIVAEVKRLTGRRGADIVVDHVGAATFEKSVVACARGGRIVVCGATAGYEPKLNLRHVFPRQLSVLARPWPIKPVFSSSWASSLMAA